MARKIIPPTPAEDKRINRGIASDPDTFEWTDEAFARARPAGEVFPDLVEHSIKRKRGQRGPQKKPRKVLIALRLDSSTVEAYKAGGRGYQTRMAAVLDKHAK